MSFNNMSQLLYLEDKSKNNEFWKNATKYASGINDDESFVSEIAYLMVTLHRTGA